LGSIREDLIAILKTQQGSWISGERLSESLSVSRAAVWKHMSRLKEEGWDIETAPGKGYLLTRSSDPLLVREISEGLRGTIFGNANRIVLVRETASTNTVARDLAFRGYPEGTVVLAEGQEAGRGRKGRAWFSPSGKGIYLSLLLRPPMNPGDLPRIAVLAAVAAAESLAEFTALPLSIKWPNDLILGDRKIGGILLESHAELDLVDFVVVGMGINVAVSEPDFPPELRGLATSFLLSTGTSPSRAPLIRAFLSRFDLHYRTVLSGDFSSVRDRWTALSGLAGKRIAAGGSGPPVRGIALGLDESGILVLRQDSGACIRVYSGDLVE
jgi:BirA family biotin operon repressor/biotin-[acetyl-CoA-carboxylase] ligase